MAFTCTFGRLLKTTKRTPDEFGVGAMSNEAASPGISGIGVMSFAKRRCVCIRHRCKCLACIQFV